MLNPVSPSIPLFLFKNSNHLIQTITKLINQIKITDWWSPQLAFLPWPAPFIAQIHLYDAIFPHEYAACYSISQMNRDDFRVWLLAPSSRDFLRQICTRSKKAVSSNPLLFIKFIGDIAIRKRLAPDLVHGRIKNSYLPCYLLKISLPLYSKKYRLCKGAKRTKVLGFHFAFFGDQLGFEILPPCTTRAHNLHFSDHQYSESRMSEQLATAESSVWFGRSSISDLFDFFSTSESSIISLVLPKPIRLDHPRTVLLCSACYQLIFARATFWVIDKIFSLLGIVGLEWLWSLRIKYISYCTPLLRSLDMFMRPGAIGPIAKALLHVAQLCNVLVSRYWIRKSRTLAWPALRMLKLLFSDAWIYVQRRTGLALPFQSGPSNSTSSVALRTFSYISHWSWWTE